MPKKTLGFCGTICPLLCATPAAAATCDPGFHLENGECKICAGNAYCMDDIEYRCPDSYEYRRLTFPAHYYNPQIYSTTVTDFSGHALGRRYIDECVTLAEYFATERVGYLYEYARYNTATGRYDLTNSWAYGSVQPGYYLTDRVGCGTFAYYSAVYECPAGAYCPGKERVVCNAANQATVHTVTFGLEPCPDGYTTDAGTTSINQCQRGACTVSCVRPTCPAHASCTYSNETATGTDYYGTGCDANAPTCTMTVTCHPGYELVKGTCLAPCQTGITTLHVGGTTVPLWAERHTTPALVVRTAGGVCYGNLTPGNGPGINIRVAGTTYRVE